MGFTPLEFTKSWENPADFPTYEPDEAQVRADLQLLHDETRESLNRLVADLNGEEAAALLPFRPQDGLTARTVQAAILETYAAVQQAAAGTLVDGSITKQKLAAALLERIYCGRVWVSMDTPGSAQNPQADFPVGQLWLRPAFSVENKALDSWTLSGCAAQAQSGGWVLTADGSQAEITAGQTLTGLGSAGQPVFVRLKASQPDSHLSSLALWLNGQSHDLTAGGGVFETALDADGALELLVRGRWPYAEAGAGFTLSDLTVVNAGAVEAGLPDCRPLSDWPGLLEARAPFSTLRLPARVLLQTAAGIWEPVSEEVLPAGRGGTGFSSYTAGQLLYAGADGALAVLNPPAGDGAFLKYDGAPAWKGPADAGILRITTGTYTGTGSAGSVTLPVTPKLLYVFSRSGPITDNTIFEANHLDNPVVLADGATATELGGHYNADDFFCRYPVCVSLSGDTLRFFVGPTTVSQATPDLCNRSGVEYGWVAVY